MFIVQNVLIKWFAVRIHSLTIIRKKWLKDENMLKKKDFDDAAVAAARTAAKTLL